MFTGLFVTAAMNPMDVVTARLMNQKVVVRHCVARGVGGCSLTFVGAERKGCTLFWSV